MRIKKRTMNQRALYLLVVLAVVSGIALIVLFYVLEMTYIRLRANDALNEFMQQSWQGTDKIVPEVYYISTDEADDDSLATVERELLSYYTRNQNDIPMNEIHHFVHRDQEVYFFAKAAGVVGEKSDGVLLVFADVSFTASTVRSAVLIMVVVLAGISFVLYLVSAHTVKMLDQKDKSMKDFFANASHELKTPLMAIRSYADGWKSGIVPKDQAFCTIEKETDRMAKLINDILEFSKLDGGIVKTHIAENDVREILYDAVRIIEAEAEKKQIAFSFDLPEPILFPCDDDMLFSAFSNILTNCVRYAKSSIHISAICKKSPECLEIRISNDGEPISKEDAEHIFERFYKGAGGQTGIGMALSREYIRLHNGTVSVSSLEGRTVFEILL